MQLGLLRSADAAEDARRVQAQSLELHLGRQPHAERADRVRFWRPLPGLDVVCGEGTVGEVPLHAHEALQLLLPVSRVTVIGRHGQVTALYPGAVHVTGPLELHGARSADGTPIRKRVMLVSAEVLATLWRELSGRRQDPLPSLRDGIVQDARLSAELHALFEQLRRPLVAVGCELRLLHCLARLLASQATRPAAQLRGAPRYHSGVARARDYLHAHVTDAVSLDDIAHVACLSKWHLLRAFRREYGLSPHAYQIQLRLARARRVLEHGHSSSYATYEAGFSDQSHLTRRFKAFFGFTPARYARQFARERTATQADTQPAVMGPRTAAPPRPAA
jgi:AraC-like DNA-binding protein